MTNQIIIYAQSGSTVVVGDIDVLEDEVNDFIIADEVDNSGPMTPEQRAALFANFTDVFGASERDQRHAFTRLVLGFGPGVLVSWARHGGGALTFAEASKVLDALNLLNV